MKGNVDYESDWDYIRYEYIKDKMMKLELGAYILQET